MGASDGVYVDGRTCFAPTALLCGRTHNAADDNAVTGGPLQEFKAPALAAALQQAQADIESEKSALVRTLHDDLGGLLVGAIMDMGWIAGHSDLPDTVRDRVARARSLLGAAIDMKRELIEQLRPTLLDNVGLFATLRWHMKASCEAASIPYTQDFPEMEETMTPEIRIAVFRVVQEALKHVLERCAPADLSLQVEVIGETLHCHLRHRSAGPPVNEPEPAATQSTAMHHRAAQIGGTVRWNETGNGRHMHLEIPWRGDPKAAGLPA